LAQASLESEIPPPPSWSGLFAASMKRSMLVLAVFTLLGMGAAAGLTEAHSQKRGHLQSRFLGLPAKRNDTAPAHRNSTAPAKSNGTAHVASINKVASEKNASSKAATIRTSTPTKPVAKSQPSMHNATVPQRVPHLLAAPTASMGLLAGQVDKFLDFFAKPDSLEFDYKQFKEMYPVEGDFSPACLAHVHRLVNKVDLSYTDVQLGTVLEHECARMQAFQYVVVDQFGSKKDCKMFAEVLVAARDEELSSGKMTGYVKFCADYYEFQVNKSIPAPKIKSGTAIQRISILATALAMLQVLFLF